MFSCYRISSVHALSTLWFLPHHRRCIEEVRWKLINFVMYISRVRVPLFLSKLLAESHHQSVGPDLGA